MDRFAHQNEGTCSESVSFAIDSGTVRSVAFDGGCSGNLSGIALLVEGMAVEEAIRRLEGIRCGDKDTSCPDQLARALRRAAGL